jgi:TctA family transporter
MSKGSFTIFFTRPISGVTMGIAFLLLLSNLLPYFKKHREKYEEFKE